MSLALRFELTTMAPLAALEEALAAEDALADADDAATELDDIGEGSGMTIRAVFDGDHLA